MDVFKYAIENVFLGRRGLYTGRGSDRYASDTMNRTRTQTDSFYL